MKRRYCWRTSAVLLILAIGIISGQTSVAKSPALYYEPFETLNFLKDDILEHAKWRTVESRKLKTVEGRFGKALYQKRVERQ